MVFVQVAAAPAPVAHPAAWHAPRRAQPTGARHRPRREPLAAARHRPAGSRGASPLKSSACAGAALVTAAASSRRRGRGRPSRAAFRAVAGEAPAVARRREVLLGPAAAALGAAGSGARAAASGQPLQLPNFGVGTWAWGDSLFWGYKQEEDPELQAALNCCVDSGVKLYDTAEIYGFGRSEELLGRFLREKGAGDAVVATKFAALPWKLSRGDVVSCCKSSLQRLGSETIGLYQIHFPSPWKNEEFWDGLGDCYEQGLVRAVGVSNYGSAALRAIHKKLADRGIPLASNQIQYSLVYRYPELNGMKATCDELGVKVLAYSPLGLGFLTGKYTKDKLPSGPREATAKKYFEDPAYAELLSTMRDIAAKHGPDTTTSQIAIAWCMAKGTIPIPGVRSVRQVQDNVKAVSLALEPREVEDLDLAASKVKPALTPDSAPFVKESVDTKCKLYEA